MLKTKLVKIMQGNGTAGLAQTSYHTFFGTNTLTFMNVFNSLANGVNASFIYIVCMYYVWFSKRRKNFDFTFQMSKKAANLDETGKKTILAQPLLMN